jgi:hypothetical protein
MTSRRAQWLVVAGALLTLAPSALAEPPAAIVLVRHAEKAGDDGNDPHLSETGRARAEML